MAGFFFFYRRGGNEWKRNGLKSKTIDNWTWSKVWQLARGNFFPVNLKLFQLFRNINLRKCFLCSEENYIVDTYSVKIGKIHRQEK